MFLVFCSQDQQQEAFYLLSFNSFIVSGLPFKTLIHWVHFRIWCEMSRSILLHVDIFFNTTYWRDLPFPIVHTWHSCWRLVDHNVWTYFWALHSLPVASVFMPIPNCSGNYSLAICYEISGYDTFNLFLLFLHLLRWFGLYLSFCLCIVSHLLIS